MIYDSRSHCKHLLWLKLKGIVNTYREENSCLDHQDNQSHRVGEEDNLLDQEPLETAASPLGYNSLVLIAFGQSMFKQSFLES